MGLVLQELDTWLEWRHRVEKVNQSREGKSECALCRAECESAVHMLWECSA